MSEMFRIIGKNDIHFDAGVASNYLFSQGRPPRKLSTVLTRREVLSLLPRLPLGIRPLALRHGLSVITMELNIQGASDADMEAKEHALIETLVDTDIFFGNGGTMGTKAELQVKSDGASETSFKSVFYGVVDELDARDVLGAVIKAHRLEGLRLTLYCEPNWRPGTFNHLFNGGFEFWDVVPFGGAGTDTEPDGWEDYVVGGITGTNNRESTPANVQQGDYSFKIEVTNSTAAWEYQGVYQDILDRIIPGVTYTLIAWVKNTVITNGSVQVSAVGNISGISYAIDSGAANAEYTRYTTTFTPHADDAYLYIYVRIQSSAAGCSGTAYIDGMMVVRGAIIPNDFIEWHPNPGIRIAPNLPANPGFEEWPNGPLNVQPDCWIDYFVLTDVATGTNNQEAINALQGCYALRVEASILSLNDYKGVRQDIRARVVNDTEYVLIAWVKNAAMTPNCSVRVYAWGAAMGFRYALNSGAANSEYTRYVVTFTPGAGDANVWITLLIYGDIAGGSGTAYFDKVMVIEASVYNGHSFTPEEWTGCGYVWNHLDKACDGAGACHVNYLDLTDLRGDVDSRLRIEMESLFVDTYGTGELTVARRTDPCLPCQFGHFLEAEDATTQFQWDDHVDVARSGCDVVSKAGAFTSGYVIWNLQTLGYNLACQRGRFRVLGAVYADYDGAADANIKFKATVGIAEAYQESRWLQPLIADTWHWLDFGTFEMTGQFWGDELPVALYWRVDFQKEADDLVELDFLLLLPEDESILRILLGSNFLETDEDAVWDNTFDFILGMQRSTADTFVSHPPIQAEPLALRPEEQNRLIFAIGHYVSAAFPYKGCLVHEDNDEHMLVSLKYLPQFVSPLE